MKVPEVQQLWSYAKLEIQTRKREGEPSCCWTNPRPSASIPEQMRGLGQWGPTGRRWCLVQNLSPTTAEMILKIIDLPMSHSNTKKPQLVSIQNTQKHTHSHAAKTLINISHISQNVVYCMWSSKLSFDAHVRYLQKVWIQLSSIPDLISFSSTTISSHLPTEKWYLNKWN